MTLKYIGKGDWLPGVPARDLTDEETKQYGGAAVLLASGLYQNEESRDKKPSSARSQEEN